MVEETRLSIGFESDELDSDADDDAPEELGKNYSFILEKDNGPDTSHPASIYTFYNVNSGQDEVIKTSGIVNVRLYSSSSATIKVVSSYKDDRAVYLGRRQDTITEVLTFANSKNQALSKGYGIANGAIIESTPFYNEEGKSASKPRQTERGLFEAKENVYGSLVVEYAPLYKVYKVEYDIPQRIIDGIQSGKKLSDFTLPPITILAFASGGYGTTLSIARDIQSDIEFSECSGHWMELERKFKKIKVYDPEDLDSDGNVKVDDEGNPIDAAYIEVDRLYEIILQCSNNPNVTRLERYNTETGQQEATE